MTARLQQLVEELRAEQIPSRPAPARPCDPRTAQQQADARRIAYRESLAYERAHPEGFGTNLREVG